MRGPLQRREQATNPHPFPSPHRGGLGGPQSEFLQQIPGAEALLHHHKVRFTQIASHAEQEEPRRKPLPWSTAGCLGHRLRKYATHCGEREMEETAGEQAASPHLSRSLPGHVLPPCPSLRSRGSLGPVKLCLLEPRLPPSVKWDCFGVLLQF